MPTKGRRRMERGSRYRGRARRRDEEEKELEVFFHHVYEFLTSVA